MSVRAGVVVNNTTTKASTGGPLDLEYKNYRSHSRNTKLLRLHEHNLQLYHVGMLTSNIPKLKPKHFRNKRNEYIDQSYFNTEPPYTGREMTITGVIETAHGVNPQKTMDYPYVEDAVLWEPLRTRAGQWIFHKHKPREEKLTDAKQYRAQLLKHVKKSRPDGKGDLSSYFGEKISKVYPLYSGLINGRLNCRHGIFIKCNHCGAIASLPNTLTPEYTDRDEETLAMHQKKPISKRDVADIIEGIENAELLGEYNFKGADVNEGMRSMIEWMIAKGSINCYNCGWHVAATQFIKPGFYIVDQHYYGDYGINAMTLEEFKLCLHLDRPPPVELKLSRQSQERFDNVEIGRILGKMQVNHINMLYNVHENDESQTLDDFSTTQLSRQQRLLEYMLTPLELQEVVLISEVTRMCSGNMNYRPTNINTEHCLYDIVTTTRASTWFDEVALPSKLSTVEVMEINVFTAAEAAVRHNLTPGMYVLHINTNSTELWESDNVNLLTPVTGSDVPVVWDQELCHTLSNNAGIKLNGRKYSLLTVRATANLCLTHISDKPISDHVRVMRGKTKVRVLLPTIQLNSIAQTLGIIGTKWEYKTIDVELVYRLLVNGITGKKSASSLMTYIAGLTATRYSVGGKLVDLTNIQVQDGIPELLYTMALLSNQKATRAWCQQHYITVNVYDTSQTLYDILTKKLLIILKDTLPVVYNQLDEMMNTKFKLMFARDNNILSHKITANYDHIQPFVVLTDKRFEVQSSTPTLCCHHVSGCYHVGKYECNCCAMKTDNLDRVCDCCNSKRVVLDNHYCGHKCVGEASHECEQRRAKGICNHTTICVCCKTRICATRCPCCFDELFCTPVDSKARIAKPTLPYAAKHQATTRTFTSISKGKDPIPTVDVAVHEKGKTRAPHSTFKTARVTKNIKIGEERVRVKNIRDVEPQHFFFYNIEGFCYNFYNCIEGERLLEVEPLSNVDIVDTVNVQTKCLLQCISRQTQLTIDNLMSNTEYKNEHTIKDAVAIAKLHALNIIVQDSASTATMIRYGAMEDKYLLIAHNTAITDDNPRKTGHWCIPATVTLKNLPYGIWNNADYSLYDISRFEDVDVFYMNDDEYTKHRRLVNDVMSSVISKGLTFPSEFEVSIDDYTIVKNAGSNNPVAGLYNYKLPAEVAQVANAALSFDYLPGDLLAVTAFIGKDTPVLEMVIEKLKSQLRQIAFVREGFRNDTIDVKTTVNIRNASNLLRLPNSLKVYKSLEYVRLRSSSGEFRWVVTGKNRTGVFVKNPFGGDLVEVSSTKLSYSSMHRELYMLSKAYANIPHLNTMTLANVINGIPGSGKSFYIRQHLAKPDSVMLSKFASATQAFEGAGFKYNSTLEAAAIRDLTDMKLVIDEAGAMDLVDLLAVLNRDNMTVSLFGDTKQITTVDFSSTPGVVLDLNVLDYYQDISSQWNESHRYGDPLLTDVIKLIYPGATKHEDVTWDTTYDLKFMGDLDDIIEAVNKGEFDLVMCFHDEIKLYVENNVDEGIVVGKAHANQGVEGNNVAVIYFNPVGDVTPSGILSQKKYINNCITRCREHLSVFTNISGIHTVQELVSYSVSGAGMGQDNLIDCGNLRLHRMPDTDELAAIRYYVTKMYDKNAIIEQNLDSIHFRCKIRNVEIDLTLTTKVTTPNNTKTRLVLAGFKSQIIAVLDELNGVAMSLRAVNDANDMHMDLASTDSSSDDTTVFYDAAELETEVDASRVTTDTSDNSFKTLPSTISYKLIAAQVLLSYKLTPLMWSRLLMLADACLLNQRAYANLKLRLCNELVTVKIFDGCSLFCGMKFIFDDGETISMSSAHTKNVEDVTTALSSQVRAFVGSKLKIQHLVANLEDPLNSDLGIMRDTSLIRRIMERLKVVLNSKSRMLSNDDRVFGNYYGTANQSFYEEFEAKHSSHQKHITHQKVTTLLFQDGDETFIYPTKKRVNTLNEVMRVMGGVNADTNVDVNPANLAKMDSLLQRKIVAVQTERKFINVPRQAWNLWSFVFEDFIYESNVIMLNQPLMDDTFCSIANSIAIIMMYKVLGVKMADVHGVNAQSLVLQNLHEYRLLDTETSPMESQFVTSTVDDMLSAVNANITKSVGVERMRIQQQLDKLQTLGAFLRQGKLHDVLLLGAGKSVPTKIYEKYDHVFAVCIDECESATMYNKGDMYVVGDNGFKVVDVRKEFEHHVIFTFGPFTLVKLTESRGHEYKTNWTKCNKYGLRTFQVLGTDSNEVCIPNVMFAKLLSRTMVEHTTIDDLLAYCRSVASTVVYTNKGSYRKYKINLDQLQLMCVVVQNIADRHRKFFKSVDKLFFKNEEDTDLHAMLKDRVITMAGNFLTEYGIPQLVSEYFDWLDKSQRVSPVVSTVFKTISDKHIVETTTQYRIVKLNNDNKMAFSVDVSQDDGNDDDDESVRSNNSNNTTSSSASTVPNVLGARRTTQLVGDLATSMKSFVPKSNTKTVVAKPDDSLGVSKQSKGNGKAPSYKDKLQNLAPNFTDDFHDERLYVNEKALADVGANTQHNESMFGQDLEAKIAAAKSIWKWYSGVTFRQHCMPTGVHNSSCATCPKVTNSQLVAINSVAREMFQRFNNYATENDLTYTLCRGTVLAALYYGQVVYFNNNGYRHWVDGDIDIAVFLPKSERPQLGPHKLHKDLAKLMKATPYYRGNSQVCAYLWYDKYPALNLKKCPKVHPHHEKHDRIMHHYCLDVAIVYYDGDGVHVDNDKVSEQLGLPLGVYSAADLVPNYTSPLSFYGQNIAMPTKWWATMSYTAAVYKNGKFRELSYPWFPGIETAGSAVCNNYAVDKTWWRAYYKMLQLDASPMFTRVVNAKESAFTKIKRAKPTVACVVSGSMGDVKPMLAFACAILKHCTLVIFKPEDVVLPFRAHVVNYTPTYKPLVMQEDKAERYKLISSTISDMTKNIRGEFDYVVGMHFAKECYLLTARYKQIRLYPLITKMKSVVFHAADKLAKLVTVNTDNVEKYSCVRSDITTEHQNLGFACDQSITKLDDNTKHILSMQATHGEKLVLITLGSMRIKQFDKLVQTIMDAHKQKILVVRGYNTGVLKLQRDGNSHNITSEKFSTDLTVVQSCNYHYLVSIVCDVYCHGGAGTIQTFLSKDVNIHVLPQGYDQRDNADWYHKVGKSLGQMDLKHEHDIFQKNVCSIFGFTVDYDALTFIPTNVPTFVKRWTKNDAPIITGNYCTYETVTPVLTAEHCVKLSALKVFGEGTNAYQSFATTYDDFVSTRNVSSVADVVLLVITANCTCRVVDVDEKRCYTIENGGKLPNLAIAVNLTAMHANVVSVTLGDSLVKHTQRSVLSLFPTSESYNASLLLSNFRDTLKGGVMKTRVLTEKDEQTIRASMRLDKMKRYAVYLRQASPLSLCECRVTTGACVITGQRLVPWACYGMFTNKGYTLGIAISVSGVNSGALYHGIQEPVSVSAIMKLNTMKGLPTTTKLSVGLVSDITAVNQSTRKQCGKLNIAVQAVCVLNSKLCYVHTTWNRKHHLERERECIQTAVDVNNVTKSLTAVEKLQLKKLRNPRAFVYGGRMAYGVEPDTEENAVVTNRLLTSMSGMRTLPHMNVHYTYDAGLISALRTIFALSSDEFEKHMYAEVLPDFEFDQTTTVNGLIGKLRLQTVTSVVEAFVANSNMIGATADNLKIELSSGNKFPVKVWEEAINSEAVFDYPFIIVGVNAMVYKAVASGYGVDNTAGIKVIADGEDAMDYETKYDRQTENKFNVKRNDEYRKKTDSFVANVTAMSAMSVEHLTTANVDCPELVSTSRIVRVVESNAGEFNVEDCVVPDIPDVKTMDYWDNFSDLHDNVVVLPTRSDFKIKSRLEPDGVTTTAKLRMEQYPTVARPSMTATMASTLNSISTRQGSFETYQKKQTAANLEYKLLKENYMRKDFATLSARYKTRQINLDAEATMHWVSEHNFPEMVKKSLQELFDFGFEMNPINSIKAHGKVEQTTRLAKAQRWFTEVHTRSIMASAYCISALFSPVFLQIKKRFKDSLKHNIVYTDGMSPNQLSAHASTFECPSWIVEDDLSKQDAATTHHIIDVEFMLYADLGLDPGLLELYKWMHMNWKWKSAGLSGISDAMRLTGQPTTSLGNTITNLVVHNRFYARNKANVILMYLLGDDNIMFCKKQLDVSMHGTETKEFYNIMSKISQHKGVGDYLCLIAHTVNGKIEFCPNFLRLRHRFSVCNYAFSGEERKEKLKQRRLSYSLMLGNIKESKLWAMKNFNGITNDWYDVGAAIKANSIYHDCSEQVVLDNIGRLLINMRAEPIVSRAAVWMSNSNKRSHRIDKATLSAFIHD
ncbi:polyprotein [viral metagenome]